MKPKPFKETIRYFSSAVPLKLEWGRGRMTKTYPLAYHSDYEFHFIKQGFGKYTINGHSFCFKAGQLVVVKPNQIHSFIPQSEHRTEKLRISFPAEWQAEFLQKLEFDHELPNLICLSNEQTLCIEMIANRILEENARRAKGWEDMIARLIQEFLLWVNRVKGQRVKPVKEKPLFTQLRQHIETHYADPHCTVTAIAKRFGYSKNYVTTLSREMSGMALKQYLQQYRIIAARRLLESHPELKVETVARQAGFNLYRSFTRAFLIQTGLRPAKYRDFCHPHRAK